MKHLDKYATKLFLKALPKADIDSVNTYNRQQRFTLAVIRMDEIRTPFGRASQFAFILRDTNGIRCPEMQLLLLDHRNDPHHSVEYVIVYPKVYIHDNLEIMQNSFSLRAVQFASFSPQEQADQVIFANAWMRTLDEQKLIY